MYPVIRLNRIAAYVRSHDVSAWIKGDKVVIEHTFAHSDETELVEVTTMKEARRELGY